jgi:hypothetical protein
MRILEKFSLRWLWLFKRSKSENHNSVSLWHCDQYSNGKSHPINTYTGKASDRDGLTRSWAKAAVRRSFTTSWVWELSSSNNEAKLIIASIIAVHGLGGHGEKSWTADDGTNWLQSILPEDLPNCRIFTWGYNASPSPNHEKQPLQTISEKLVLDLYKMRELTRVCSITRAMHD